MNRILLLSVLFFVAVSCQTTSDAAEWSQALAAASARLVQSGKYHEIFFSQNDGNGNFLPYTFPGLEQGLNVDAYSFPTPHPGGRLRTALDRGVVFLHDSAGANPPWIDTTGTAPSGIAFQLLAATYSILGQNYGVTLTLNDTIYRGIPGQITGSNQALDALLASGDSTGAYWSTSGAYTSPTGAVRRSIAFQKALVNVGLNSYFSVLASSNITSLSTLQATIFISEAAIIGTIGAGPRQTLVSLFPQAQIVDFITVTAAIDALNNGTALAIALITIPSSYSDTIKSYPLELITEIGSFTNQPYALDVANPFGREALASAFEAGLVGASSQGIRKIAIGTAPAVTIADCNPAPSSFPFPSQVGLLKTVMDSKVLRVGELRAFTTGDYSPWYITNTTGAIPRLMNAIANTMISNYNQVGNLEVRRVYFETVTEMFLALRNGSIDMTSPFMSPGSVVNGTLDFVEFRQSCSLLGVPYVFYIKPQTGVTSLSALLNAIQVKGSAYTVSVPNAGAAQLLQSMFNASYFVPRIVNTMKQALTDVRNGDADAAFGWKSDLDESQSLTAISSGAVRTAAAFFKKDDKASVAKKKADHQLRNGIIGLGCALFVLLVAGVIALVVWKQFHVVFIPKSATTDEAW